MLEYFAIQKTLNDLFLLIAAVIMTSRSYFSRSSPLKDGSSTSNQSSVTLTNHATAISDKEIQQSKLLIFCYFLNYVTGYTGLISSSIHVYSLTFNSVKWISDNFLANVVVGISHMYLVFLGILIYFTERESAYLFKYFGFLESWIGRGLFYILCSVWLYITTMHVDITIVDEHMEVETSETHSSMFDLHEAYISSSLYELIRLCIFCLLWICGCLYICMSCLCVNYFKKAQISKIKEKKEISMQAEKLSKQKLEIERLLQETNRKLQTV